MSTVLSFADLSEVTNSPVIEREHRDMLTSGMMGTYVVRTANSNYVLIVHGTDAYGYTTADVVCPPHRITGDAGGLLLDVVPRILDDRLVLVDSEDVRRVVLRTSTIVAVDVAAN